MKITPKHPVYIVAYAAVLSAVFTGAIMALYVATRDTVRRNEALLRKRALVRLFGLDAHGKRTESQISDLVRSEYVQGAGEQIVDPPGDEGSIVDPVTGSRFDVIRAYGADGDLIGYAFSVWGVGFWARISGLIATNPELTRSLGIVFLQHSETPGLGGRITEPRWNRKFAGRDLTPPAQGQPYLYIGGEAPPKGSKRYGRHVDAITGATGTSKAVEAFLNQRLPEIRRAAEAAGLIHQEQHSPPSTRNSQR